jgi:hypothetical protein
MGKDITKIFTCSLSDYMKFHNLNPNNFEIFPFAVHRYLKTSESNFFGETLYQEAEKLVKEINSYVAVVDTRISQSSVPSYGKEIYVGTLYGTALVRKIIPSPKKSKKKVVEDKEKK